MISVAPNAVIIGVSKQTIYSRISEGILPDGDTEEIVAAEIERQENELAAIRTRYNFYDLANPAVPDG